MSEWQLIKTAPNAEDNPDLEVLVSGGRFGQTVQCVLADGNWWRMRKNEGSSTPPTHWMPLPEPPTDTPEEE